LLRHEDSSKEAHDSERDDHQQGRLTLPKAIRDLLRLGAGDRIGFVVKDDGTVVLRPAAVDVRELRGMLHRKGLTPLTIEEMNAIIRRRGAGRT
jgi:AbrB family looped-hinge helix DNA binding protein